MTKDSELGFRSGLFCASYADAHRNIIQGFKRRQREINVTARLLPRAFVLDAVDDVRVRHEVFEEVVPFLGGASGVEDHFAQLFDPMIASSVPIYTLTLFP